MTKQDWRTIGVLGLALATVIGAGLLLPLREIGWSQSAPPAATLRGTLQNAATANGNGTPLNVAVADFGMNVVTYVVSGTFTATVNFEATQDTSNWTALTCYPLSGGTPVSSATTAGAWRCNLGGAFQQVRARISGYSSGAVTVTAMASYTGQASLGSTPLERLVSLAATATANQLLGIAPSNGTLEYKTLQGTANQVSVTPSAGALTLSTPQNLHTGATPTFAGLALGSATAQSGILNIPNSQAISARNGANTADIGLIYADAASRVALSNGTVTIDGAGLISASTLAVGTNPAQSGLLRIQNNSALTARNGANTGDISLIYADTSNNVIVGGQYVVIASNGNVGISTSTPGYTLTINGTAWVTSGAWSGSDRRWKKDITPLQDALGKVMQLRPVKFAWRTDEFPYLHFSEGSQLGLIAQDVENIIPDVVTTDNHGYKGISYEKLIPVLIRAIQEQQAQINHLEDRVCLSH